MSQCTGRQCGDNGCGGVCGICPEDYECNDDTGQCVDPCAGVNCSECQRCDAGACVPVSNGLACSTDASVCTSDVCIAGSCQHPAIGNGTPCSDGNACNGLETCQGSTCAAGTAVFCDAPPSSCHTAAGATCNPVSGACSYPTWPEGITCAEDGSACTADICQAGRCVHPPIANDCGGRVCGASPSGCQSCGSCAPGWGCNAAGACDDLCAGVTCPECQVCAGGSCVGGLTNGAACTDDGNVCTAETCEDGTCDSDPLPDSTTCDDENLCTTGDTCQAGNCAGTARTCPAGPECRTSAGCNLATGECDYPAVANGTSCSEDGDLCTDNVCSAGECTWPQIANDCGSRTCGLSPSGCYPCGTCAVGETCRDFQCTRWTLLPLTDAPSSRSNHIAVWATSTSEMLIFSGLGRADGARYSPASDSWAAIPDPGLLRRENPAGAWTGSEMIMWGGMDGVGNAGFLNTGGRYSPATNGWEILPTSGAPSGRAFHSAVWTGSEFIIWGGYSAVVEGGLITTYYDNGGRYRPASNAWFSMTVPSISPRRNHVAVWTGSEMIVWGGDSIGAGPPRPNTGARYSPSANEWVSMSTVDAPTGRGGGGGQACAIWSGSEMVVWGGYDDVVGWQDTGGRYNPTSNAWRATSTVGAPTARTGQACATDGTRLIVWGGVGAPGNAYFSDGGIYDPTTDTWTPISSVSAPSARRYATGVWTGSDFIVWGGENSAGGYVNTGGRYTP